MGAATNKALFYPLDASKRSLKELVEKPATRPPLDTVEFDDEKGGGAVRQLAIPRLPGMDEVEIDLAQVQIRSVARPIVISDFTVQPGPDGQGVFLSLKKPGQLLKLDVEYITPIPTDPATKFHLVVRAVQKTDSGKKEGVPLFAAPDDFPRPGDMFQKPLTGMSQKSLGGNRFLLTLPSVLGDAWLIQLAIGDKVVDLKPTDTKITIHRVTLNAVPSNVSVVLVTESGEVPLWENPQMLLPTDDVQNITFTPLAQKELSTALNARRADELTLPLTLKFRSDSAGALEIVSKTLSGRYVVRAIKDTPTTLQLSGSQVPLVLSAPAGVRPQSASFRLVAKLKGRELNNAAAESHASEASSGLRVTQSSRVAQKIQFTGTRPLVNVRLLLATESAAEAVVELHQDASGGPGALEGKAIVEQLKPGLREWVDFELKEPLRFATNSTTLWLTLHVTKGEVLWFATDTTSETLISTDEGVAWSVPDARLSPPKGQAVQLFHERFVRPVIRVDRRGSPVIADLMASAQELSIKEFVEQNFATPATITSFFSERPGKGRVDQTLQLFSTSVLDLRVESASFFYDPFEPGSVRG